MTLRRVSSGNTGRSPLFGTVLQLSLLAALAGGGIELAQAQAPREIAANADAWVWLSPDTARITALLSASKTRAAEARAAVDTKAVLLEQAVKKIDAASRFETRGEIFSPEGGKRGPLSATASVSIERTVGIQTGKLDKVAAIIDALLASGADKVLYVEYSVARQSVLLEKAVADASLHARNKALALAQSLGIDLGPVVSASVTEEPHPAVLMMKQRLGVDLGDYSDRDLHIMVDVRFETKPKSD